MIHAEVFKGKDGQWYWHVQAENSKITAEGGEGFHNRNDAQMAAEKAAGVTHTVVREHLPWQPSDVPNAGPLGRHVEWDSRSLDHLVGETDGVYQPVRWLRHGTVLNQGQLGSCTGNAMAGAINTNPVWQDTTVGGVHPKPLVEKDALWIYEQATIIDGFPGVYPPDDTGSSGLAVCKVAKAKGWIKSYQHATSVSTALAALMTGPVIVGVNWYSSFDQPDQNGLVKVGGYVRGGHEFEIIGYDPATDLLEAVNSWSTAWGVKGHFFFTAHETLDQLIHEQGDVQVPR